MPPPRAFAAPLESDAPDREALLGVVRGWPSPAVFDRPLEVTPEKAAKGATALGLNSVGDLIQHLPFRHDDRQQTIPISAVDVGMDATVAGTVRSIQKRPTRSRRVTIIEAVVEDETGRIKAIWFNQYSLLRALPSGTQVVLHGTSKRRGELTVSEFEKGEGDSGEALHTTGLVPVHSANADILPKQIRQLIVDHRAEIGAAAEPLPAPVRVAEGLPDRGGALDAAHFPASPREHEDARKRLAFEEALLLQLALLRRRAARRDAHDAAVLAGPRELTARWLENGLPFTPTGDQDRAMAELEAELAGARPMARLLMGEVGSGKTVVALFALLRAVEHGMQGAFMAPTEVLAEQHFATLQSLIGAESVTMGLLTGSTPAARRRELLDRLASGEMGILVGTHAIIEEPVRFAGLAVVVVDEQHRFGVEQRRALDRKAVGDTVPHVLHMTATPIPRTLALTTYGDLDVTQLRELPRGRQPIATYVCSTERERDRAYERIREEVAAGRQAFVVCPLVEGSEAIEARSATEEFERLQAGPLRSLRLALLHGRMRPAEKQAAMASFADGAADVLVATTVIEVGIDIPNATVMLVENAERFGISQLHQLRGRIGRGEHESLCLVFGPKDSPRLKAIAQHTDGFALAEVDLELRGEGDIVGLRQSGLPLFRVARLPDDELLLERARTAAGVFLDADPELETPAGALLLDALERSLGPEASAPIPA